MWTQSLQIIAWLQNEYRLRRGGSSKQLFEGFYQVFVGSKGNRKRALTGNLDRDQNSMSDDLEEVAKLVVDQDPFRSGVPVSTSPLYGPQSIVETDHHMDIKIADYMIEKYLKALRRYSFEFNFFGFSLTLFHQGFILFFCFRFPKSTNLRISFLYYLADFTRHTTIALYNLQLLEKKHKLSLDQRVQLFRLKGLLDDIQLTKNRDNTRTRSRMRSVSNHSGSANQNTAGGPGGQSGEGFVSQIILLKLNSLFNSLLKKLVLSA